MGRVTVPLAAALLTVACLVMDAKSAAVPDTYLDTSRTGSYDYLPHDSHSDDHYHHHVHHLYAPHYHRPYGYPLAGGSLSGHLGVIGGVLANPYSLGLSGLGGLGRYGSLAGLGAGSLSPFYGYYGGAGSLAGLGLKGNLGLFGW